MVMRTRRHRYLSSPFCQSHLYRVDLFRPHGDWLVSLAAPAWLLPVLSDLGLSRRPGAFCHLLCADRSKPSRLHPNGKLLRPAACRSWLAGLLLLAPKGLRKEGTCKCPSLTSTTTSIRRNTWRPCVRGRAT